MHFNVLFKWPLQRYYVFIVQFDLNVIIYKEHALKKVIKCYFSGH